jgi:hypothetical protein
MRSFNSHLNRAPIGLYALSCGLVVLTVLARVGLVDAKHVRDTLWVGLAAAVVVGFVGLARERIRTRRERFAKHVP